MMLSLILILSLLIGQLIKLPITGVAGVTVLDLAIFLLDLVGLCHLKFRLPKPPLYLTFGAAFILVGSVAIVLNPLHLTTTEQLISLSYAGRFLAYIGLGWLISIKALPSIKKQISQILAFSGIGLAILGLIQLALIPNLDFLASSGWDPHYYRTVSTLLDPNFLGVYLSLTLALLALNSPLNQKLTRIGFGLVYLALVTTFSRSATIMFGVTFLTICLINRSKRLFILTFGLGLGFILAFFLYHQFIAEPRNINRTQSASFRLSDWQEGLTIYQSSPIIGVGFNSYRYALKNYQLASPNFIQSRGGSSNDSSLLFVAATSGVLGLVFYLLFIFNLLKRSKLVVIAGLIGLLVNSLFIDSLFYPWILCWLALATNL